MVTIDESMLNLLLAANCVSHFDLREADRGYEVFVGVQADCSAAVKRLDPQLLAAVAPDAATTLSALQGGRASEVQLMNSRGAPRSWVSLDRFVSHLKGRCEQPPEIRINQRGRKGGGERKRRAVSR
jgi:hypothetical protein